MTFIVSYYALTPVEVRISPIICNTALAKQLSTVPLSLLSSNARKCLHGTTSLIVDQPLNHPTSCLPPHGASLPSNSSFPLQIGTTCPSLTFPSMLWRGFHLSFHSIDAIPHGISWFVMLSADHDDRRRSVA